MKLTIGMATHTDYHGVYMSIQHLRMMRLPELEDAEFVVVDTNPTSEHGAEIRNLAKAVPNLVYVPAPRLRGTAPAKGRIFRIARGEIVVVIDSHVMLVPEAIPSILRYFDDPANHRDIVSGPIWYDHLNDDSISTHLAPIWRGEMLGIWARAWQLPNSKLVTIGKSVSGTALAMNLAQNHVYEDLGIAYEQHEPILRARGWRTPTEPFEIPAQGCGMFACRYSEWPGFHKDFEGFGGEEVYIQEKFRRAGGKAVCIPEAKWVHRFGRPGGSPYPILLWDKVRNYVIGFRELGLDLQPIYDHFVRGIGMEDGRPRMSDTDWKNILAGKRQNECQTCGQAAQHRTIDDWYAKAQSEPSDINEHVAIIREYASRCSHITEFGTRRGVSTAALLHAKPKKLVTFDVYRTPEVSQLEILSGETEFVFRKESTIATEIEETDLLLVDTIHTAEHVEKELAHAAKVRKYLVFHDTVTFGEAGEGHSDSNPVKGILHAIRAFVRNHPEWNVVHHTNNNNGLLILSKVPEDRKAVPPLARQARNLLTSMFNAAKEAIAKRDVPIVDEDTYRIRLETCDLCVFRSGERCSECGCVVRLKAGVASDDCPRGKWPKKDQGGEQ